MWDDDDQPQCLNNYTHGPAIGERPAMHDHLGVTSDGTPMVVAGEVVELLCAECLGV